MMETDIMTATQLIIDYEIEFMKNIDCQGRRYSPYHLFYQWDKYCTLNIDEALKEEHAIFISKHHDKIDFEYIAEKLNEYMIRRGA